MLSRFRHAIVSESETGRGWSSRNVRSGTVVAVMRHSVGGVDRDGKVVHVSVPSGNGAGSMFQTVRTLDDAHLEPATLLLREPTLDDVFLSLTGHAAEEAESGDDDGGTDDPTPAFGPRARGE